METWLIARQSNSILDLTRNMRYEGHPVLWFLMLYAVTRFTRWLPAMQLLNVGIASCTAYLVAEYSPFTRFQKVLFCFGYFPLYEYGTISRNYGVGLFLLFLFCVWYRPDSKQEWIIGAVFLSLLANTSVYGTMIAIAFAASFFAFPALLAADTRSFLSQRATHAWTGALIFCISLVAAIAQMHPPADTGVAEGWHFPTSAHSIANTLTTVLRAFLPIPNSLAHFWNSSFFFQNSFLERHAFWPRLASPLILLIAMFLLARKRLALLAYVAAAAAMLLFMHVKYMGSERHFGHLFIVFIACLWISARMPDQPPASLFLRRAAQRLQRQQQTILVCILAVQLAVAAIASSVDWIRPFSQGKAVAAFLRTHGFADMFIVADGGDAQTVAGYLDRELYYTNTQHLGSFIVLNKDRLRPRPSALEDATEIASARQEDVLILSNHPMVAGTSPAHEIAQFTGSIVPSENYYLYLLTPDPDNNKPGH